MNQQGPQDVKQTECAKSFSSYFLFSVTLPHSKKRLLTAPE